MKNQIILLIILITNVSVFAQSNIRGKITDSNNGEALSGASIFNLENGQVVNSNDEGEFQIEISGANNAVEVTYLGYITQQFKVSDSGQRLNITLQASSLSLSEVIVSSFESRRKITEVAGGIAVLSSEEIQRYDNSTLQPALNAIPGVRMESYGPGGSSRLSIRGSLLRSPFGIRGIKAYWNELPLTDAGGAMPYDILEPTILGSMEIIKGPAGSIYGAGSGGVILFRSDLPRYGENSVETSTGVGSFGLRRYGVSAKFGSNNARFQVGYVDQEWEGYRPNMSTYRKVLNMTGQIYTGERGVLSMYAYQVRRNFELPGLQTLEEFQENPFQTIDYAIENNTRLTSESANAGISYQYDLSKDVSTSVGAYVSHNNTPEHPYGTSRFNGAFFRGQATSVGGRARINYRKNILSIPTRLSVGAEVQRDRSVSRTFRTENGQPAIGEILEDNELVASTSILFGQLEGDLPGGWVVTLGASVNTLSYDIIDLHNPGEANQTGLITINPALSPRLSLVKKLNEGLSAHASVSRGFSPPTRNEVNTNGRINTNLIPEDGINYETGVRGRLFGDFLQLDITAYTMKLRNILVRFTLESGLSEFENAGAADQRGVELMLSHILFKRPNSLFNPSRIWVNYALNDYKFSEYVVRNEASGQIQDFSGNNIPGISPHTISGGIDLSMKNGLYGNITYFFFDDRFINNNNESLDPGYSLLNTKVGYRKVLIKQFEIDFYAGIENIGNTIYTSNLGINGFGGRHFTLGTPRSIFGGMSLKYNL